MERRSYLKGIGSVSAVGLLAGCSSGEESDTGDDSTDDSGETSDGSDATGVLATSVSDMPGDIGDFESLVITIAGVWIKPAGGDEATATPTTTPTDTATATLTTDENGTEVESTEETDMDEEMDTADETEEEDEEEDDADGDSGRRYIEFSETHDADLVQLKGSKTQLLEEQEVAVGEYEFLQLDIVGTSGTLTDGSDARVDTPGNAPLKFNQSFEVREDERTTFIADFTPFQRGNGSYLIRPVASETQVLYGDETPSGGETMATADSDETETMDTTDDENETTAGGDGSRRNASSAGN